MGIKNQLKKYNISQSLLAKQLFISRPTLNTYINLYENNKKIPSRKYQLIFDKLFFEEKTPKEFHEALHGCNGLLAKDEILEITDLSPEHSDLISNIIEDIKNDLSSGISDNVIYLFIRFIINYHKKINALGSVAKYFLTLNGYLEYGDLSEYDKMQTLYYYDFYSKLKSQGIQIDSYQVEKDFIKRIKEIQTENHNREKLLRQQIEKIITEEINNELASGKPIEKIDIHDILRKINEKNNGS